MEDPSNTIFDPNFPGAWHLPGTTSAMKIAGYVNLAVVDSFDPLFISDRFIVGSIPPEGQDVPGAKSGSDVTANQTRINFEVREETSQGSLRSNFTLSWVNINNFDYQDGKNYKSTLRASANPIYLPTTNVRFGAELLWGQRKNKDESKGIAMQLQVSARYNF